MGLPWLWNYLGPPPLPNEGLFRRCCGWGTTTSQVAVRHQSGGGAAESPGWRKIECFLLYPQSMAGLEAAHSQLHGPPAAKSDLVWGNIFSQRPCLQFRRPGHMLWNEVGRQTKRVVICPHSVAIDLLLYAAGFLEATASTKNKKKSARERDVGGPERKKTLHVPSKDRFLRPDLPGGPTAIICLHHRLNKWSTNNGSRDINWTCVIGSCGFGSLWYSQLKYLLH